MNILNIVNEPTTVNDIHESVYRSYHILNLVEDLLGRGVPSDVILELLRELREAPRKEVAWEELDDSSARRRGEDI